MEKSDFKIGPKFQIGTHIQNKPELKRTKLYFYFFYFLSLQYCIGFAINMLSQIIMDQNHREYAEQLELN